MSEPCWLTDREQKAWRAFLEMHSRLSAELARRLAAESSLSIQDYEILVTLTDRPDGRLRLNELGELVRWEKSRLSHHVTRMAERGLVKKVRCESDRRGSFVAVTPKGRREIEAAAPGHVAAVRELFIDRLTRAQLEAITSASAEIFTGLERP